MSGCIGDPEVIDEARPEPNLAGRLAAEEAADRAPGLAGRPEVATARVQRRHQLAVFFDPQHPAKVNFSASTATVGFT